MPELADRMASHFQFDQVPLRRFLIVAAVLLTPIYLLNASWLATPPAKPQQLLIAHRGVYQTFDKADLTNDTCTAQRIHPPRHELMENTIPSMQAAFRAAADVVELDVHPTTDGKLAVLHDWTIDCRTEGKGPTRSHSMTYLKTLDIGYGYTADGGKTFPLRGKGVGLMPSLDEVLAAMPDRQFLINFKSNEAREGDMLAALVAANPQWRKAIWGAYGGDPPTLLAKQRLSEIHVWTRGGLKSCLLQYIAYGWTGIVPQACRNTQVMVPINVAPWLWGWPNRFQQRMADAGSGIILLGPYASGDVGTSGVDTLALLHQVPASFSGAIWTNRIELIGPVLKQGATMRDEDDK
jgi:glycerophosphoryl diester phosphodiesterase